MLFIVCVRRLGLLSARHCGFELSKHLQLILLHVHTGANSLIQATLPRILCPPEGSSDRASLTAFSDRYKSILRENALMVKNAFADAPAITPVVPHGAMYAMIGIEMSLFDPAEIPDDAVFAQLLLKEENLFVLPGKCFGMDNFVRLVMCPPAEMLQDACERMKAFCARHTR